MAENPTSTEVTSVACNHCGAPLDIGPTTNFVTCAYCGYKLQVHRSASSVYTEVLESIDQRTAQMQQDLNVIKRQNEVERLDREWSLRRDELLVRDKHGQASEPSIIGGIFAAVVGVVFGIAWIGITSSQGAPGFFTLFGVLFMIAGLVAGISSIGKAARYSDAHRTYEQQRDQLMREQNPPH